MKPLRVGIIGCGSIGSRHARNVVALGHVPVMYDIDDQHLDAFARLNIGYVEYERLGKFYDLDAVLICTPAHTHASVLLRLRDAGYAGPLFVEKPICDTLTDARVFLGWPGSMMIGYQLRFHPALRALKASVPQPTGGGFYVDCDMQTWPGADYGLAILEMSHELDAALFCGAPSTIDAREAVTVTDTRATFWLGQGSRWLIDMDGSSKTYLRYWMLDPSTDPPIRFHSPEELGDQMYRDELAHFLHCVETGAPIGPGCTAEEGIRVLEVIEAARKLAS